MGLVQRVILANRERHRQEQQDLELTLRGLQRYSEIGDDDVRNIAESGILEILAKPDKYKGNHLQQIQQLLQQKGGAATPAAEFGGPPLEDINRPADFENWRPTPQPGEAPGGPPPAPAGPPPTAAMPATSLTQQPGQAVGTSSTPAPAPAAGAPPSAPPSLPPVAPPPAQPPAGELFSATTPEALGQEAQKLFAGAGVGLPQGGPDTAAIASEVARQYGYTPEQLADPNFVYVGGLLNPRRVRDQQEYRLRLAQATQTAEAEYRMSSSNYAASVRSYVGQVAANMRTDKTTQAAQERQAAAQKAAEDRYARTQAGLAGRAEASSDRAAERQARAAWASETAAAERQVRALRADPSASIKEKMDPGIFDRMLAEARQAADDRYRAVTGQEPPSAKAPAPPAGPKAATAPPPGTSRPGTDTPPPAAPAAAGSGSATPPPPSAPIGPEEERRAAILKAKITRQGSEALTAEDRAFMADYTARKRRAPAATPPSQPARDLGYIPGGPF